MSLVILSTSIPRRLARYGSNIAIRSANSNDQLHEEYEKADIVCVPLKPNLHASGITVIQEAVLSGVLLSRRILVDWITISQETKSTMYLLGTIGIARSHQYCPRRSERGQGARKCSAAAHGRSRKLRRNGLYQAACFDKPRDPEPNMRTVAISALALILLPILDNQNSESEDAPLDFCKLQPAFMENFGSFRVNSWNIAGANWIAHTPWHGDFGDAAFADPGPGGPFSVVDGVLNITARKNKPDNGSRASSPLRIIPAAAMAFCMVILKHV